MNPIAMQPCPSYRQTGLSLVELMISLTIGLFLLLGITTLIVQQSSTRGEMEKSSRQIENGRYAMQILHNDIQHAGLYGEYSPPNNGTIYTTPNECVADGTGWDSAAIGAPRVPVAIFGYAGAAAVPSACAALTNYQPNTAILVVRRTTTASIAATAAVPGTTYIQTSRCSADAVPFQVAGYTLQLKDCPAVATRAPLYRYLVNIYYISQCSMPTGAGGTCAATDDNSNWIPTLMLVQNGAAATPLVEGIENMQFDYGVDAGTNGSPDGYTTATAVTAAVNWANVMAVRVNLLARNNDRTTGYQDTKRYNMGLAGLTVATNDRFKRHAYSQLVRVINHSGRRE